MSQVLLPSPKVMRITDHVPSVVVPNGPNGSTHMLLHGLSEDHVPYPVPSPIVRHTPSPDGPTTCATQSFKYKRQLSASTLKA